jgi:hypothetical protein
MPGWDSRIASYNIARVYEVEGILQDIEKLVVIAAKIKMVFSPMSASELGCKIMVLTGLLWI